MYDPIQVALIGHGPSGAKIHAPLIEATAGYRLRTVATSRPETLASRRDAPTLASDPFSACVDPEIDLVVIATPNDTHYELAMAALRGGKHVVIDKPFALSTAEADALIEAATTERRVLGIFHNRRWDGDFEAVRAELAREELGDILLVESHWDRFRPHIAAGWRNSDMRGAGVLWDLGPHLIDQALCLFGLPQRWEIDREAQRAAAQADDYFVLTLHYGRMRCVLGASSLVAAARPRFAIHGTRGSFLTEGVEPIEAALARGERPDEPGFYERLEPLRAVRVDAHGARVELSVPFGHWEHFYRELALSIREGAPPPVDPLQARETIQLLAAAHGRG